MVRLLKSKQENNKIIYELELKKFESERFATYFASSGIDFLKHVDKDDTKIIVWEGRTIKLSDNKKKVRIRVTMEVLD